MMSSERWLPVVGWEGYYEVSDHGQVRSVDRVIVQVSRWGIQQQRCIKGKALKPRPLKKGHLVIQLSRRGRTNRKMRLVHHLVLEAFVGPRPPDMQGCHWNDIAGDNRLPNLRWDTQSANEQDKVRNGRHHYARRTQCGNGHEYPDPPRWRSDGGRRCLDCEAEKRRGYTPIQLDMQRAYKRAWRAQRRAAGLRAS